MVNRTSPAWTVVSASTPYSSTYTAIKALDGSNTTAWFAQGADNQITLDMQANTVIKGFVLTPTYVFGAQYNATKIEVLSSTDNVVWTSQGSYTGNAVLSSSAATTPDNRNINFYAPVSMRCVKLVLNGGLGSGYNGFAEINAIK